MNEPPQSSSGKDLLEVLMDLLHSSRLTQDSLEAAIHLQPELLASDAQLWLSVLGQVQDTAEARTAVNDLARLLRRLQTENMAAVFSDEASRSRRRAARQAREARLRTAQEKFLAWRKAPGTESVAPTRALSGSLPSLAEVVTQLRSISVAERRQPYGRDALNPHAANDSIPSHLFRGESGTFKSTHSSMARLNASVRALEDVASICDRVVEAFGEKWGLTPTQSLGFLQHYGYPTDYIDVTSNVSVAASFASSLRVGEVGAVCILPTERLLALGSLIDLRHHPVARRPRLQSAFAVHIPEYPDLKAPAARAALELTWIEFQFTYLDAERFVPDSALLDARSDEVAGLIWLFISDCAKFGDEAASLLSNRIDPAPVFSVVRSDGKMVLVSEDDMAAEEAISDEDFRRGEYQFWSDAFPTPERQPLPPELQGRRSTDLKPGTSIRVLTSRAIRRSERGARNASSESRHQEPI